MTAAVSSAGSSSVSSAGLAASLMAPPAGPRGPGFAQVLSAHQAERPHPTQADKPAQADKPVAADKPKSPDHDAPVEGRVTEEARANKLRAQRPAAKSQGSDAPPAKAEAPVTDVADADVAARTDTDATDETDDTTVAVDPAIADWLARLNLPEVPPAGTAAAAAASTTAAAEGRDALAPTVEESDTPETALSTDAPSDRGTARRTGPGAATDTSVRQRESQDDAALKREAGRADTQAGEAPMAWQAALEQAATPAAASARPSESFKVDGASALSGAHALAAGQPVPDRATEVAAPTVVHVPTRADGPEFPKALGAQLSVLARDGIEQAELHLNPDNMGPISVQIVLDGNQAKVDFGADSAATRQVIENGLPELAAAMREAGFTLSGGGVHSQAQGQRGQGEGRSTSGQPGDARGTDGSEPAEPARPVTRARLGGIDLYA